MTDSAGSTSPDRRVEGRIQVDILGVPDAPGVAGAGRRDPRLQGRPRLAGTADQRCADRLLRGAGPARARPSAARAPRATSPASRTGRRTSSGCAPTTPSGSRGGAAGRPRSMPDKPIDMNGRIELVARGDGTLTIDWKPVMLKGGGEAIYVVRSSSGETQSPDTSRGDVHRAGQPPDVHVPGQAAQRPDHRRRPAAPSPSSPSGRPRRRRRRRSPTRRPRAPSGRSR